jgi:hypothetical protein
MENRPQEAIIILGTLISNHLEFGYRVVGHRLPKLQRMASPTGHSGQGLVRGHKVLEAGGAGMDGVNLEYDGKIARW